MRPKLIHFRTAKETINKMKRQTVVWEKIFANHLSDKGSPGGSVVKNPPDNAGDTGDMSSIPGSGRSPGVRNDSPLHYSCPQNSIDRGA